MAYIPSKSYPYVVQTTDPLLIRFDRLSLLVGDCNFYAKVETGQYWSGFKIMVSGIGNAVYERKVGDSKTKAVVDGNGNIVDRVNIDKTGQFDNIAILAAEWLDNLETAIAEKVTESGVAKEIESLKWQLHYDLTKTSADIPDDVEIDKSFTLNDMNSAITGSITTLDSNLSDSTTGSVVAVASAITVMDNNLTGTNGAIPTAGADICTKLAPTGYSVYNAVSSVASNLRDVDNNEYTISKALRDRDTSDNSVSYSTYQQTQLESTEFGLLASDIGDVQTSVNGVSTNLGAVDDSTSANTLNGKLNSVKASVGVSTDTTTATLFGYNKVLNDNISTSGSSSAGDIATIKTNTNTIITRLGSSSSASGTIWGDVGSAKSSAATASTNTQTTLDRLGTTSTKNTIWWDILHNPGISSNTAGWDNDSIVGTLLAAI